ncbi:MAG: FAD binding domain-containing protein [Halobacteriales archaeon]|nr:FAD binding domain-containing protein [Halobacteriales archaeon]
MLLPPFQLHEPASVEDAVRLKREHPDSDWVAGGTDLLPNYKWALNARPHVISLARIASLRAIGPERIGALATLRSIAEHAELKAKLPVLPLTAGEIASPLVRASATLGGNLMLENRCFFFNQSWLWRESKGFCKKADGDVCLVVPQKEKCYATFSADLPAPLIALGASLVLAGAQGTREVPVRNFYTGDGMERNVRQPGELLTEVRIPRSAQGLKAGYKKLRQRGSWDFPEMGMAAALRFDGQRLAEGHLVANALETTPVVLDRLLQPLLGQPLTDQAIAGVAKQVEDAVQPVKNTSLPPSYRKAMTRPFTKRLLTELRDGAPLSAGPHHRNGHH